MDYAIHTDKITKSFDGKVVVDNVDLRVCPGETFGLLGGNGAGKTTLVECILGVKKPDSGYASVLGMKPLRERKRLFEQVGVQFQEAKYADKIRVGELCRATASLYRDPDDYHRLLEEFGLQDKEHSAVGDLSGGQKQRLFIILALIPKPRVVFLDELTTGLDVKARRDVWRYLKHLKQKDMTIFMTSHFMDEVEVLCDRIAVMKQGSIVFRGTVPEIIASGSFENLEDAYLSYAEEDVYESI